MHLYGSTSSGSSSRTWHLWDFALVIAALIGFLNTATPTQRRLLRRRRARARRLWFLHRQGLVCLSQDRLKNIYEVIAAHHSRDQGLLRRIRAAMTENPPWRCIACKKLRKGSATHCKDCQQPWQIVMDHSYVHSSNKTKVDSYTQAWSQDNHGWESQQWNRPRSKSRPQTPNQGRRSKSTPKTPRSPKFQEGKGAPAFPGFPAPPAHFPPKGFQKGMYPAMMPWTAYGPMTGPMMAPGTPMPIFPMNSMAAPLPPPPHPVRQRHKW